jgi:hypothetical protein
MKAFFGLISTLILACSAQAYCPGDANVDLRVDTDDILFVISHWDIEDTVTSNGFPPGDCNYDGDVDIEDIILVISVWGLGTPSNPYSCYPYNAPTGASPECITSVFEEIPFCEHYWEEDCTALMCEQSECQGTWCPN